MASASSAPASVSMIINFAGVFPEISAAAATEEDEDEDVAVVVAMVATKGCLKF